MNPDLRQLHPYPFEKLSALKRGVKAPGHLKHIALSIGEPQHPAPEFVIRALNEYLHQVANYPKTHGSDALRESIASWLCKRFSINPEMIDAATNVLPVSGTREGLFAIAQCLIDRQQPDPLVFIPNPFYQIYEGAALLAGAKPHYLDCEASKGFLPDLEQITIQQWQACQLFYICTPGNPSGAVMPTAYLQRLIELAHQHNFVIASDECYSEIYFDEANPPPGILGVAAQMGNHQFKHCLAFHSLSKRSNLPGLRSGFVAGDAELIEQFLRYRTYHGSALPTATQSASAVAWADEAHVIENRARYRDKFEQVLALLSDTLAPAEPQAGFYLWAKTPIADTDFAQRLFAEQNISVLPGRYLSRQHDGKDPGLNRVRMALVAPTDDCIEAANRINQLISTL